MSDFWVVEEFYTSGYPGEGEWGATVVSRTPVEIGNSPHMRLFRLREIHEFEDLKTKLAIAVEALEFYASAERDTSKPGWQYRWEYKEIKNDDDYAFYPNHDVAVDALEKIKETKEDNKK